MLKIAIIGVGSIGKTIIDYFKESNQLEIVLVHDINTSQLEKIEKLYRIKTENDFDTFVKRLKNLDVSLVVEAAGIQAVYSIALPILNEGIDLALMSTGFLGNDEFVKQLKDVTCQTSSKIYLPSGAIAGLDGVRAAAVYPLESVILTTTKSPKSLGIQTEERKLLFEGSAREVIKKWPKNLNVAISLASAGIGLDKTKIKLYVDPSISVNQHIIDVNGSFGKMSIVIKGQPSKFNPKTSLLAPLSMIDLLERLTSHILFM